MTAGNNFHFTVKAKPLSFMAVRSVLVIAPHPDDESLGCGGTIALLREAGVPVNVIFVSDGSMSHPASKKYPAAHRVLLREGEAVEALGILGVSPSCIRFLRWQDGAVPARNEPGFSESVRLLQKEMETLQPDVLLAPWRRDPHRDHQATAAIVWQALTAHQQPVRMLEYFVWLWERSQPEDLPTDKEVCIWEMNIQTVMDRKQKAVMAHVSQVSNLIDDDPDGFTLSPEVLSHFWKSVEFFAEAKAPNPETASG